MNAIRTALILGLVTPPSAPLVFQLDAILVIPQHVSHHDTGFFVSRQGGTESRILAWGMNGVAGDAVIYPVARGFSGSFDDVLHRYAQPDAAHQMTPKLILDYPPSRSGLGAIVRRPATSYPLTDLDWMITFAPTDPEEPSPPEGDREQPE